ncbi:MAG: hypothetical protein JWO56_790 [Acidobacteria bacterium]|nr:hypothetical protein [Acidobacteriota bacterium]
MPSGSWTPTHRRAFTLRFRPPAFLPGVMLLALTLAAVPARASDTLQWNGFALLRPQTPTSGVPLDDDSLSAQVQVAIDWRPTVNFGSHLHLLARNEADGSRRGRVGVVEAYLEQNAATGGGRIHVMEGAFFLPTSRENVDSLWETPYTITSSALNSWLGEEFRPIGVDLSYTRRLAVAGALSAGATVFTGNDTFGALPIDRGWALRDHWALLGEHIPVNATFFTSVSAETDHRLGWSARGRWSNDHGTVQFTRIDNRADAQRHGELFNWATRFNIAGADYTWHDWTAAAETGWGSTAIQGRRRFSFGIRSSYLLFSRRIATFRASVRGDRFEAGSQHGHALTAALFWEPARARLRTGIEAITADGQKRLALEFRYRF